MFRKSLLITLGFSLLTFSSVTCGADNADNRSKDADDVTDDDDDDTDDDDNNDDVTDDDDTGDDDDDNNDTDDDDDNNTDDDDNNDNAFCDMPCKSDLDCPIDRICRCPDDNPDCGINEMCCYELGENDDDDTDDDDDIDDDDNNDDNDDGKCASDVDCMNGGMPECDAPTTGVCVCKDEQCVEGCLADKDCPATEPICNTADKVCCNDPVACPQMCARNSDCTAYAGYTYCDTLQAPAICVELVNCDKTCPAGMTLIWAGVCDKAFCMDTYEASDDGTGRAQSVEGAFPWNEITYENAQAACEFAGKSLCTEEQWKTACDGRFGPGKERDYSYGDDFVAGQCNDSSTEQPPGPVNCGAKAECKTSNNQFGGEVVYDLTGNVAEWVSMEKTPPYGIIGGSYHDACPNPSKACALKCNNIFPLTDGFVERIAIGFRCCAAAQ